MFNETENSVDQGTESQGAAEGTQESANTEAVSTESEGATSEAPKVVGIIGDAATLRRLAELVSTNDILRVKSDDDTARINELVTENTLLRSEVEKLHEDIETLKHLEPLELGAVQQGKPVDVTMTAKDYGFPEVRVHGELLGQLHYLDAERADVIVFATNEQVTVRPCDVRILKLGDGTTRDIPAK